MWTGVMDDPAGGRRLELILESGWEDAGRQRVTGRGQHVTEGGFMLLRISRLISLMPRATKHANGGVLLLSHLCETPRDTVASK